MEQLERTIASTAGGRNQPSPQGEFTGSAFITYFRLV